MKTLIASVALLLILTVIIIGNVFYINQSTEEIRRLTESITVSAEADAVNALKEYWKKHKKYFALSVSYSSLDEICDLVIKIESAYKAGNSTALEKNKELLFDELIGITRFEKISLENIF